MKFKHLKTHTSQELRHFWIREFLQLHEFQKLKALYPPKIVRLLKLSPDAEVHRFETYPFPELRHSKSWEFLQLRTSQTKAIQRVENSSLLNVEAAELNFSNFGNSNSDFVPSRLLRHFTRWNLLQWRASPKLTSSDVWRCTPDRSWATLWASKIKERLRNMSLFIPVKKWDFSKMRTSPAHYFWTLDNLFMPKVGHFVRFSYSISSASWGVIISSWEVETRPNLIASPSSNSRKQLSHVFH